MAYEKSAYREALKQLSRDRGRTAQLDQVLRDLQAPGLSPDGATAAVGGIDLALLLAIDEEVLAGDLPAHLERVRAALNVDSSSKGAALVKRIIEQLTSLGVGVDTLAFWHQLGGARERAVREQLATFAATLSLEFPLKVITPAELAEVAAAQGLDGVSEAELHRALGVHGLEVHPDFDLPDGAVPDSVLKALETAAFRSLADILTLGQGSRAEQVRVIGRAAFGTPPVEISPDLIEPARVAAERRDDDASHLANRVLAELRTYFATTGQLRDLMLAQAVTTTQALLRRGKPRAGVHRELVQLGYHPTDAARLVGKLAGSTAVQRLSDVTDRLAEGALGEAQRLLATLPELPEEKDERERVAARVADAVRRKQELVAECDRALELRQHGAASAALRAALGIDREDRELARRLEQLPPPAPAHVHLRIEGRQVVVSWTADGDAASRFTVVRTGDTVPANPQDGEILVSDLDQPLYTDASPPVGRTARYTVFASRDGRSYSDGAGAMVLVLPSPEDLVATAGMTEAALSWTAPVEAAGVVVTRISPDGSTFAYPPTNAGQLAVPGLTTGTKYRFAVRAIYVTPQGREESAAAEVDITPRGVITAVGELLVENLPHGGRAAHRVSWASVVGYPVEIWAFPVTVTLPTGVRREFHELQAAGGERLTGISGSDAGGRSIRELAALPDLRRLVALTVDGAGGLLGASRVTGSAPAVGEPRAQLFGDEVRLSWSWPPGDHLLEVAWRSAGHHRTERVTRTTYNATAGVSLPNARNVSDISVATVVRAGDEEWISTPVPIAFTGVQSRVRYQLRLKRSLVGGRATAVVAAASEDYRGALPVLAVLKEGSIMPGSVQDGRTIDRAVLDLGEGTASWEFPVGKVSSPYWVRLFPESDSGVRLDDPPTSQLRG